MKLVGMQSVSGNEMKVVAMQSMLGTLNKSSNIRRDKWNLSWLATRKIPIKIQIFKMRNNELFQEKGIKPVIILSLVITV